MSGLLMLPFLGLGLLILAFPVVVLILLILVLQLRGRVRTLQARLEALERDTATRPSAAVVPETPVSPLPPVAEPAPSEGAAVAPVPPVPEPAAAVPVGPSSPPDPLRGSPTPVPPAPEPARHGAGLSQLEGLLGGTWLNRVGALLLVLGIGFFLKYAFENEWIGPAGRVSIGLLAGIGFLLLGERLQRAAYRVPAQGLVAAGIATLYLSVYAAHGFYQLVAASSAFAFMVLVTATGMAVAIHHDARAIALLANIGGFLTPLLLSTGTDAAVALFTYLAILDSGMLASAYWRRWTELSFLSFAFTQLLYWGWVEHWYRPARLPVALIASSVFFALFAVVGLLEGRGGRPAVGLDLRGLGTRLLILATPTAYFLAARQLLAPAHTPWLALLCLGLATAYLLAGHWSLSLARTDASLALLHFALALAFLTLTFAVQLTEHALAIAWSVEGVALLWGGFRLGAPKLRAGACVVLALAWTRWFTMLPADGSHGGTFLVDHPALPATVVVVVSAGLAAALYRPRNGEATGWEAVARPVLILVALGSAALFVTIELNQFRALWLPPPYVSVLTTVVWVVTALPLLAFARRDQTRILLGAVTLLLAGVGAFAIGEANGWGTLAPRLRPVVLNPRFLSGLLIVVLYGLYARVVPEFPFVTERSRVRLGAVAGAAAALFLLWNLSAEIMLMPIERVPRGEAAKLRSAALSVLWALYAFVAMGVGMWRRWAALRIGAIALFGLTVAKVFLVDLNALDAVYRILSFLVLGVVLILASFLYTKYRRRSVAGGTP